MSKIEEGNFLVSSFWLRFLIEVLRFFFIIVFGVFISFILVVIVVLASISIKRRVNFHWWRVKVRRSIWVLGSISVRSNIRFDWWYYGFSSCGVDIRDRKIRLGFSIIGSWFRFRESRVR